MEVKRNFGFCNCAGLHGRIVSEGCIRSLLQQQYPREQMEWIFVDGGSSDKTLEILQGYQKNIRVCFTIMTIPGGYRLAL